jgi:hypothetical protein
MGRRLRFVCQLQSSGDVSFSSITFQVAAPKLSCYVLTERRIARDAETWE